MENEIILAELKSKGKPGAKQICNTLESFLTCRMFDTYARAYGITYKTIAQARGVSKKAVWMNATSNCDIRKNVDYKNLSRRDQELIFYFWKMS